MDKWPMLLMNGLLDNRLRYEKGVLQNISCVWTWDEGLL